MMMTQIESRKSKITLELKNKSVLMLYFSESAGCDQLCFVCKLKMILSLHFVILAKKWDIPFFSDFVP